VKKAGIQRKLALVVLLSVVLAAVAISASLFFFSLTRSHRDIVRQSREMVEAAALAFSRALSMGDEVLLDALVHELVSRERLHINDAFVIDGAGRVVAHSEIDQYGKTLQLPTLLQERAPPSLSEVKSGRDGSFRVLSLLQDGGKSIGALSVNFSTRHLSQEVQTEMLWIAGITVPVLLVSGLVMFLYGRSIAGRLRGLQIRSMAVGRGELTQAIEVRGSDEISQLASSFNQMISDLAELRRADQASKEKIEVLNRDLTEQLRKVEQLKEQLAEENSALREELRARAGSGDIIGFNGGLRSLADQVKQLASLPVTALITGESGVGKELLARYLHEAGVRREGPFIAVNCAALPLALIESELFGHEKGAFTGAMAQKKGKFELAHKGTLFLDEIGELSAEAQAKLLRALQDGEIVRVGGERPVSVDVRLIAATNRNLEEEIRKGKFRQDLYYRLKVVELKCPALRERLEDLPALAQHFIEHYARKLGKGVIGISPSALTALSSYDWPGNVRELENIIARAVALATTQVLGPEDFVLSNGSDAKARINGRGPALEGFFELSVQDVETRGLDPFLDVCERRCLEAVMEKCRTQKEAADVLKLTPTKLHRLLKKHGMIARLKNF
jgi:transcriptional regulator with GAF, ATPase, and Fis domain